ncbi:two-component system, response regulator YesN [Paenibacillus sp. yr247]|uniref:response regulator n=1 Tax=Paenibacillus sp. yr247 TaxID=1761880 RepID=UPI00088F0EA2|nr:response regulator [Paenibacillus sp. yr247]SDN23301.1 two-component system, response regulator YesN [Paenibacillus sp. yr247]
MNVLVVDDEPIIRLGLRTLVDWEKHGFTYAGDAEDGLEACGLLEPLNIDIVITDLIMPRMDGLALIRMLRESARPISTIVLSCMDDFTYVKEAMKLGAKDYILKPTMEPESLLEILQVVKLELEMKWHERKEQQNRQLELASTKQMQLSNRLQAYLQTSIGETELQAELFGEGMTENDHNGAGASASSSLVSLLLHTGPTAAVADWRWTGCLAALPLAADSVMLLVPAAAGELDAAGDGGVYAAAAALERAAEVRLANAPDWFIGAGVVVRRLLQVKHAAELHARQLHERFYSSSWNRLIVHAPEAASMEVPYDIRSDLLRCVAHDNSEGYLYHAEALCRKLREQRPEKDKVLSFIQELLALAAGYARERGYAGIERYEELFVYSKALHACSKFEQVKERLLQAMSMLMENQLALGNEHIHRSHNTFIRKVLAYMMENYASPISTSDMADHVRLSRSYLSDLYSKEMGESLSETLTRIRMEEAKRRLRTGEMKVYEVADAVGFPDAKTFAKTFKRVVGCSPKEFVKPM